MCITSSSLLGSSSSLLTGGCNAENAFLQAVIQDAATLAVTYVNGSSVTYDAVLGFDDKTIIAQTSGGLAALINFDTVLHAESDVAALLT